MSQFSQEPGLQGSSISDTSVRVSETLYELRAQFTQVTEYGVSMEAFLAGAATPPPEGFRVDVAVEGTLTGQRLDGSIRGVDYLHVRADGHTEIHFHATIVTPDGASIAFSAHGVGVAPDERGLVSGLPRPWRCVLETSTWTSARSG